MLADVLNETVSDVIARRVREIRRGRGWTAAQLEARLADLGAGHLSIATLSNIETGRRDDAGRRRRDVTADELLALAVALSVAPVHLLIPLDDGAHYSPLPTGDIPADWARDWVRGYRPLPEMDRRVYFSEVPPSEWRETEPSEEELAQRQHERARLRQALRERGEVD